MFLRYVGVVPFFCCVLKVLRGFLFPRVLFLVNTLVQPKTPSEKSSPPYLYRAAVHYFVGADEEEML